MVRRIVTIIISLVAAAAVYSCTSANSISPEGYANQGSKTASESAALSSYEQKEKLEDTGKELLDLLDEENWEDTADFFKELAEHFAELDEDGMEAFEEWSEEMEDEIMDKKARGGKMTIKRTAAFSRIKKGTFKEDDGYFEFTPGGSSIKVITYVNGKLEVTPLEVTITADSDTKVYDGTALTKDSYTSTDLASGDSFESVTVTGSQTVVGKSDNVASAAKIVNAAGEDVTAS